MNDGLTGLAHKKARTVFLVFTVCAVLTLVLLPKANAAPRAAATLPADRVSTVALDYAPEPVADLTPLLKPGYAFKLGVEAAEKQPPVPDCGRKEMLARQRTVCIADPAFIPVEAPAETLRLANANIKVGLPNWREDYLRLLSVKPDFLTLQEMAGRTDEELAIQGYAVYRSHEATYTKETPVLYDTGRWEALDTGTRWLTLRKVKWGERAVNWVTLKSKTTGRVVSVVSAHPAPTVKRTEGLLPIFMDGLYPLVEQLHERGEVLVAGDFNVHYQSGLYQQAGIPASNLEPTFDAFGKLATGRHYGATIDYMFSRRSDNLVPTAQGAWLQNSDHNAIWSDWTLTSPTRLTPIQLKSAVLTHSNVKIKY